MNSRWYKKAKSQKERQAIKEQVVACSSVLERLKEILKDELASSQEAMRKKDMYELPSWEHKIADSLGEQRALINIINLLTFK